MREDLLLRGANLLEEDALNPEGIKFNLGTWAADAKIDLAAGYRTPDARQFDYHEDQVVPVNCGTQACAFGLFAISGAFKDEGLSYAIYDGKLQPVLKVGSQTYLNWDAVAILFDIGQEKGWQLFSADFYDQDLRKGAAAEIAVATRMREMVANNNK